MSKKVLFISDVHFQGNDDAREEAFLRFLKEQMSQVSRLVIVGDLFDFWIGYEAVIYYPYFKVLKLLSEYREAGIDIDYIEGNHDFHMGSFFRSYLGCTLYASEAVYKMGGYQILVCHGDLLNQKDTGHQFLSWFLRTSFVKFLIKVIPPDLLWKMGHHASRLSQKYHRRDQATLDRTRRLYQDFAKEKLSKSSADILILGHSHTPDEATWTLQGRKKIYYNLGDWVQNFTYLEFSESGFHPRKFEFIGPAGNK